MADETPNSEPHELEFYALALSATKRLSSTETEVMIKAWALLSDSLEEATEKGVQLARDRWPEAEGWTDHCVSLSVVERGFIREALRDLDASDVKELDLSDDAPEVIM